MFYRLIILMVEAITEFEAQGDVNVEFRQALVDARMALLNLKKFF